VSYVGAVPNRKAIFHGALAAGLGLAFGVWKFGRQPQPRIEATAHRSFSQGVTRIRLSIRNESSGQVSLVGFQPIEGVRYFLSATSIVEPHSSNDWEIIWEPGKIPRSVTLYIAPWTSEESEEAKEKYSRLPEFVRDWLMRKYDPHRPEYRREIILP
jgi:hypothetical protein